MKRKRFPVEQIAGILKQGERGTPVSELCRQHGISEQSYYRWRKVYGKLEPSEVRQLKELREENARLKRMVAELSLDKVMLQDVLKKSGKAGFQARDRALLDEPVRGGDEAGVRLYTAAAVGVLRPQYPRPANGTQAAGTRDCGRAGAVWLPTYSNAVAALRVGGGQASPLSDIHRGRSNLAG